MDHQKTPAPDIPKWSALLVEAVNKPGLIMAAYTAFHPYSMSNQMLAIWQCTTRSIPLGPLNTYPGWKALGRQVKRGERALMLCMLVTRKRRDESNGESAIESGSDSETNADRTFTAFVHRANWFALAQTDGEEVQPSPIPQWDAAQALAGLNIERIPFDEPDGNIQGYARARQIAINPVAQLAHKTLFHEAAHVVLGHTAEASFKDGEATPRNLREVEAEAVALLCCEALGLEGPEFCRGYIQQWLYPNLGYDAAAIPEKSAQKIFRAADQILRAGRHQPDTDQEQEH
jgi:N-terminal domain of anti-restriction factor ArdC